MRSSVTALIKKHPRGGCSMRGGSLIRQVCRRLGSTYSSAILRGSGLVRRRVADTGLPRLMEGRLDRSSSTLGCCARGPMNSIVFSNFCTASNAGPHCSGATAWSLLTAAVGNCLRLIQTLRASLIARQQDSLTAAHTVNLPSSGHLVGLP